jgi:hypothetical protein
VLCVTHFFPQLGYSVLHLGADGVAQGTAAVPLLCPAQGLAPCRGCRGPGRNRGTDTGGCHSQLPCPTGDRGFPGSGLLGSCRWEVAATESHPRFPGVEVVLALGQASCGGPRRGISLSLQRCVLISHWLQTAPVPGPQDTAKPNAHLQTPHRFSTSLSHPPFLRRFQNLSPTLALLWPWSPPSSPHTWCHLTSPAAALAPWTPF